ncbi:hypothetical protein [Streptomyces melanosporofaciens]|uniref:hypothetical protein n=1 Tax=Streptomyces melanosporofaciens TaxID=67327 RepID=UPI001FCB1FCC|nr:hypothetical protein [Streptomyces melanosporofaciens]
MLATDLGFLTQQIWAPVFPAALIVITAGALNLLADAVRDAGADELLPGGAPDPATGSPGATADTPDTTKEQADAALPVA